MSYFIEGNFPTFKQFLNEINYGSLQKDDRINKICDALKKDILYSLEKYTLYGSVLVTIPIKTKNPFAAAKNIKWSVKLNKVKQPEFFTDGGYFDREQEKIVFGLFYDTDKSDEQFLRQFKEHIESGKIDETLKHEIKHYLDKLDGKFTKDNYVSIDPITASAAKKTKYVSQNREIESWLISVLSDIEYIKKSNPHFSIQEVFMESKVYNTFMKYLHPSKRNKYKNKIIHFWYTEILGHNQ
jgi:hypothetical protein